MKVWVAVKLVDLGYNEWENKNVKIFKNEKDALKYKNEKDNDDVDIEIWESEI